MTRLAARCSATWDDTGTGRLRRCGGARRGRQRDDRENRSQGVGEARRRRRLSGSWVSGNVRCRDIRQPPHPTHRTFLTLHTPSFRLHPPSVWRTNPIPATEPDRRTTGSSSSSPLIRLSRYRHRRPGNPSPLSRSSPPPSSPTDSPPFPPPSFPRPSPQRGSAPLPIPVVDCCCARWATRCVWVYVQCTVWASHTRGAHTALST